MDLKGLNLGNFFLWEGVMAFNGVFLNTQILEDMVAVKGLVFNNSLFGRMWWF